jgi:hypothetical protein
MAERAVFIGFGQPVRGREERAIEVFNDWVGMLGRMQGDGRIEGMTCASSIPTAASSAGSS